LQLDRARYLAVHHEGGDRDRPALHVRPPPHGGARRPAADGRRRALPAPAGRRAGDALDPLSHARLLSADRRDRERGGDAGGSGAGDAAHHHQRAPGPRDRQGRRRRGHGEEEAGGVFLMGDANSPSPLQERGPGRGEVADARLADTPPLPTLSPEGERAYVADALIAEDIEAYLELHQNKGLLRFITCGSVDDGKSTLIGRLLYDSKMIFEDQLAALEADSKRVGTQGQDIDFALLVDGLAAEREQGITIDVAY